MSFYRVQEIQAILDLSGGDLANELLPYLDYEVIGKSQAEFWGYSDLTTILNAIYAKTGRSFRPLSGPESCFGRRTLPPSGF